MKLHLLAAMALSTSMAFSQTSNALNFDGVDDHITANYGGITGTNPRSVEAWIRTSANANPSAGGVQQVITDWGTGATGSRFTMCLLWSNSIRVEVAGNGISGTTPINDGNWHHVAVTYDNSAAQNVKLYIDGSLETQGNFSVGVNTSSGTNVIVGRRIDGANPFTGDIDEVRVWNKVLSAAEIQASMNKEFCQNDPNLQLYYQFNQGTAGGSNTNVFTALDQFGTRNGTLQNFALSGSGSNWVNGKSLTSGINGSSQTDSVCESFTLAGGRVVTATGIYQDTLTNASGCDSIITYDVTIKTVNTAMTRSGYNFTAQAAGAQYQWVRCDSNYAPISGATSQTYTASANGDYAVIVTEDGCSDTSECKTVTGIGIEENSVNNLFKAYPNPSSNGIVTLEKLNASDEVQVTIVDIRGVTLHNESWGTDTRKEFTLPTGVYIIRVIEGTQIQSSRLVVL